LAKERVWLPQKRSSAMITETSNDDERISDSQNGAGTV
jgi:hypothetical protein